MIATAEDDWGSVVKPRLAAHDADLARVHRVAAHDEAGTTLLTLPDDVPRLEKEIVALRAAGHAVAMLVVDPIGVNLADGRITVGASKTDAGLREVDVLPILRDELAAHKAASHRTRANDLVFTTRTGAPRDRYNLRQRVVMPVARKAGELLEGREAQPLPAGVSLHMLRHTFASILVALDNDPSYVMGQLGHTDPAFTLRVYTHMMRRDAGERDRLRALVAGTDWAPLGTSAAQSPSEAPSAGAS